MKTIQQIIDKFKNRAKANSFEFEDSDGIKHVPWLDFEFMLEQLQFLGDEIHEFTALQRQAPEPVSEEEIEKAAKDWEWQGNDLPTERQMKAFEEMVRIAYKNTEDIAKPPKT